jgi:hypothetical protein
MPSAEIMKAYWPLKVSLHTHFWAWNDKKDVTDIFATCDHLSWILSYNSPGPLLSLAHDWTCAHKNAHCSEPNHLNIRSAVHQPTNLSISARSCWTSWTPSPVESEVEAAVEARVNDYVCHEHAVTKHTRDTSMNMLAYVIYCRAHE